MLKLLFDLLQFRRNYDTEEESLQIYLGKSFLNLGQIRDIIWSKLSNFDPPN